MWKKYDAFLIFLQTHETLAVLRGDDTVYYSIMYTFKLMWGFALNTKNPIICLLSFLTFFEERDDCKTNNQYNMWETNNSIYYY